MYCVNCGNQIEASHRFCSNCGVENEHLSMGTETLVRDDFYRIDYNVWNCSLFSTDFQEYLTVGDGREHHLYLQSFSRSEPLKYGEIGFYNLPPMSFTNSFHKYFSAFGGYVFYLRQGAVDVYLCCLKVSNKPIWFNLDDELSLSYEDEQKLSDLLADDNQMIITKFSADLLQSTPHITPSKTGLYIYYLHEFSQPPLFLDWETLQLTEIKVDEPILQHYFAEDEFLYSVLHDDNLKIYSVIGGGAPVVVFDSSLCPSELRISNERIFYGNNKYLVIFAHLEGKECPLLFERDTNICYLITHGENEEKLLRLVDFNKRLLWFYEQEYNPDNYSNEYEITNLLAYSSDYGFKLPVSAIQLSQDLGVHFYFDGDTELYSTGGGRADRLVRERLTKQFFETWAENDFIYTDDGGKVLVHQKSMHLDLLGVIYPTMTW